ncbi:hypothetical protein BvRS1_42790 [Burkholderia vietnamiensis]|nr:hypothetical protein BvRS1_42790 [Burkholderia vietnamiensis]
MAILERLASTLRAKQALQVTQHVLERTHRAQIQAGASACGIGYSRKRTRTGSECAVRFRQLVSR